LPFYYYRPSPPSPLKGREYFGLSRDDHVYACVQTLFKFHPDFDEALRGILQRDSLGRLILIKGKHQHWQDRLMERWQRVMPEVLDRITWLPPQKRDDFLNLMAVSDVLLDTFPFSGGNTSYEGLALGVPIVTLETAFMRGRITYAQYKKMGMMDCVARTPGEYINIAVDLGTNRSRREEVSSKILSSNHLLFEDIDAVRELEVFFKNAVQAAQAR